MSKLRMGWDEVGGEWSKSPESMGDYDVHQTKVADLTIKAGRFGQGFFFLEVEGAAAAVKRFTKLWDDLPSNGPGDLKALILALKEGRAKEVVGRRKAAAEKKERAEEKKEKAEEAAWRAYPLYDRAAFIKEAERLGWKNRKDRDQESTRFSTRIPIPKNLEREIHASTLEAELSHFDHSEEIRYLHVSANTQWGTCSATYGLEADPPDEERHSQYNIEVINRFGGLPTPAQALEAGLRYVLFRSYVKLPDAEIQKILAGKEGG